MLTPRVNVPRAVTIVAALGFVCCEQEDTSLLKAIYGQDDRRESIEAVREFPELEGLAAATFLLMPERDESAPSLPQATYGEAYNLCPSERFVSQPVQGFCTGVLVGPSLLLTASHCLRSDSHCRKTKFIRNYQLNENGKVNTKPDDQDVFDCRKIVYREADGRLHQDLVLVELEGIVTGTPALPLERSLVNRPGTRQHQSGKLVMAGHPRGLPKKIVTSGEVRQWSETVAETNLDAFVGNSGSPVVDKFSGKLIGLLTKGSSDFQPAGNCNRETICGEAECAGEAVTLTGTIGKKIPEVGPQLQITSIASPDAVAADSWTIGPGESRTAVLTFQNIGGEAVQAGDVTVRSRTPGVQVAVNSRSLKNIGPGESVKFSSYRFWVDGDVDCSVAYEFKVETHTAYSHTESEYQVLPGTGVESVYEHRGGAVLFLESSTVELPIIMPAWAANARIFPFLKILHRNPELIEVAVSPPTVNASDQRFWHLQKVSEGQPSFGELKIWEQMFGKRAVPFQDLNNNEQPIAAGTWLFRITDFSGARDGEVLKAGFLVQSRSCQKG